jgi:hypothetical protein
VGDGGELCLEVEGSGFLHRMVRHMAGKTGPGRYEGMGVLECVCVLGRVNQC